MIAGNAPLEVFKHDGPPTPDDGLSVDIETSGTTVRPIATLPAIRDADLTVRIVGRNAVVNIGRGTAEVAHRAQTECRERSVRGAGHPSEAGIGARGLPH